MLKKRVIFVCVGNSCRSQMAEGFFNYYAKERGLEARAESAGTQPAGYVHPNAIKVMREKGIDTSHQRSKGINPEKLKDFDYVITMGCSAKNVCPAAFHGEARDWGIEDPIGQPIGFYRRVRDEIERKVLELIKEIEGQEEGLRWSRCVVPADG